MSDIYPLFPEWDEAAKQEGERRRDEAMDRVSDHAPAVWTIAATNAVKYVARHRPEMTSDPVWYVLRSRGVPPPPEPRALGPVMKVAVKRGWLQPTGRWSKSVRPECNRRDIPIYRSLLYKAQAA